MQNLFAYYQAKEANYLLAFDYVKNGLQPNLNLDVPEKKSEMAEKEREAIQILKSWKSDLQYEVNTTNDSRIDDVIDVAISNFDSNMQKDYSNITKKMLLEVEFLFVHYIKLLQLIIEFSYLNAENNLGKNVIVQFLIQNEKLSSELIKKGVSWQEQKSLLKKINKEIIHADPEFLSYFSIIEPSKQEDADIVSYLLKTIIFSNEDMLEFLQTEDLYWEENKNILKSMVKKTIKDVEKGELLKISQNWEDDKVFFKKLFQETISNDESLNKLITEHSKNWEKDRLALTDVIILKMGVTEMLNFSSIPIKVTINEYIEISKIYSTPKSKQFINGLLDKFSGVLIKEGKIKKSGRGLIDNK